MTKPPDEQLIAYLTPAGMAAADAVRAIREIRSRPPSRGAWGAQPERRATTELIAALTAEARDGEVGQGHVARKTADGGTRIARPRGKSTPMRVPTSQTKRVGVTFKVDPCLPPAEAPVHDALRSLRAFELEAPTPEMAELYGALLLDALERTGNSAVSGSGRA